MSPGPGWRWARAIVNASTASSRVIRLRSAQPTTRREKRSRMTTRYSQPSRVQRYVMSDTQAVFGAATVNCRSSTFAATGSPCCESRRALEASLFARPQALFSHQARHAMAPNVMALGLEFPIDPGTPVAPPARGMGGRHLHGELLILAPPGRHRPA